MGVGTVEGRLPLISVQQQADGEFHVQTPESLSVPWFPQSVSLSGRPLPPTCSVLLSILGSKDSSRPSFSESSPETLLV